MDNEQTTQDFEQVPVHSFNADSHEETLSVLLKYKTRKSFTALALYFLLLLLVEAGVLLILASSVVEVGVLLILASSVENKVFIYMFAGSLLITVLFLSFMLYGMIKSTKKQLAAFRASPPSYVNFELYAQKLVIKKYVDGELKSLYTAEKGSLKNCDVSKNVFIFNNNGIDFGIKLDILDQHPEVKNFIVQTCQRKSKKISV